MRAKFSDRFFVFGLGVKPSEVVDINLRSCPEWLYFTYGAMIAGIIPVGISFTYADGSDVVATMQRLKTCALLLVDPGVENENWKVLEKLVDTYSSDGSVESRQMPYLRYLISHEKGTSVMTNVRTFKSLLEDDVNEIVIKPIQDDATMFLFQTSGSTGTPKLVAVKHTTMLSYKALWSSITQYSKYFNDRPFTWAGGFPTEPIFGGTRVTISGFFAHTVSRFEAVVKAIASERCTKMFALPPIVHEMIQKKVRTLNT